VFGCSGIEHKNEVYSCSQLTAGEQVVEPDVKPVGLPSVVSRPQVVTTKLFVPAPVSTPSPTSISPPAPSVPISANSVPVTKFPSFSSNTRPQTVTRKTFVPTEIAFSPAHSPTAACSPARAVQLPHSSPPPPMPLPSTFSRPQAATSKIFAPRTEEMNKGFLMFSEEEPGVTGMFLQESEHCSLITVPYYVNTTVVNHE